MNFVNHQVFLSVFMENSKLLKLIQLCRCTAAKSFQIFNPRSCCVPRQFWKVSGPSPTGSQSHYFDEERLGFNVKYVTWCHVILDHQDRREVMLWSFPTTKKCQIKSLILIPRFLIRRSTQLFNDLSKMVATIWSQNIQVFLHKGMHEK